MAKKIAVKMEFEADVSDFSEDQLQAVAQLSCWPFGSAATSYHSMNAQYDAHRKKVTIIQEPSADGANQMWAVARKVNDIYDRF